jgi:branched-chain amino acid transport system substrate-binding protein
MMKRILAASAALALSAALAHAQEVKIGLVAPFTGIGAELGQQIDRGVQQYLKLRADEFKPYKITIIKRDDKKPSGADSKIAVQELLTQENVDALAGWIYSPNAIASAPVVTAGKKIGVIMNAGTAHITTMSPLFVRTSFSMWHAGYATGRGCGQAAQGQDRGGRLLLTSRPARTASRRSSGASKASGGKVIDEIPMGGPGAGAGLSRRSSSAPRTRSPTCSSCSCRPATTRSPSPRTYGALGMKEAGIKLIGPGDITQDIKLQAMGDAAVGLITMHHYNADLDNAENKALVASWTKDYGKDATPDFVAIGAYDGMAALAHMIKATKGKLDNTEAALASLKDWKYNSPRGPISIDPATRDIVMNEYLVEVVKGPDGKLHQKPIGKIDNVKGPLQGTEDRPLRAEDLRRNP